MVSELRRELRYSAQQNYGGYCSICRKHGVEPVPYHKYTDYFEKGYSNKEIYRMIHTRGR